MSAQGQKQTSRYRIHASFDSHMKAKTKINEIETHAKVSWIRKTRSVASKTTHCEWRPRFRVAPVFDPTLIFVGAS
jgi:hypothetical protein